MSYTYILLLLSIQLALADHYRGGTLSWKPLNPTSTTGSTVPVIITERHSWTYSRYPCNLTTINTLGVYNDTEPSEPATLTCISSSSNCLSSLFTNISSPLFCTDVSTTFNISSGTYYTQQSLASGSIVDIAWRGAAWTNEVDTNSFSLVTHIDLTPINGVINSSPVSGSLPIIQTYIGESTTIQISVGDIDNTQIVRCRWSKQTPLDECGNVCDDLPNAQINTVDCYITWTPVLRSEDSASGKSTSMYVVTVTVEDYVNATSSTPLSSVPHQMLVYVSPRPANACPYRPGVSGFSRRNLACYGVTAGSTVTYTFWGTVSSSNSCINASIVDFISLSPLYTTKGNIYRVSNYTWGVSYVWTVNANQAGLQPFCIAAVDNHGQSSSQYCVIIMVSSSNPSLMIPSLVQSSASPVGTVMSTQSQFSIQVQTTVPLRRTRLSSTYIYINQIGGGTVYYIDCRYSPDVYFLNNTIVFFVPSSTWTLGMTYYVTMTDGVATADEYCGVEASGYYGTNWQFTIWKPAMSSTMTTPSTTTTPTTVTVTTRGRSTTTYNTLYTTTGIPAYTVTTTTSTTSTTSTSATTTTTTSATTTTTTTTTTTEYVPNAVVIYPKDMERDCLQPVTIATILITAAFIPLHLYGMISLFSKMNSNFQKDILKARSARRILLQSANKFVQEEQRFL